LICVLVLALVALAPLGCEKVKSAMGRATIPTMGPKLPYTLKMEFDPALTTTRLPYINACNAPFELRVGPELEAVLLQAAGQNFKAVQFAGAAPGSVKPDVTAQIVLQQSSLKIQTDGIYDRLPAELNLEAAVAFKNQGGGLLGERIIKTSYRERLLVEPTQHRCDLVSIDAFLENAAVSLSIQFIREARTLLDPEGTLAGTGQPAPLPVAQASPTAVQSPAQPASPPITSAPPKSQPSARTAPAAAIAAPATVVPVPVPAPAPVPSKGTPTLSLKPRSWTRTGTRFWRAASGSRYGSMWSMPDLGLPVECR
jgi:hypothetical protein